MGSVRMLHSLLILSNFKAFLLVTVSNKYENFTCICPWIYLHINSMEIELVFGTVVLQHNVH